MQARQGAALIRDVPAAGAELRRIRWDTWSGMFYSDITAYFIILATAVTLHVAGITDIDTAAQAASALRPLAGDFAYIIFALGILGVGFIGVPVLAGSGAYALSEAMGWKDGLERKAADARGFYGVIAVSVLVGLGIQYSPIRPPHLAAGGPLPTRFAPRKRLERMATFPAIVETGLATAGYKLIARLVPRLELSVRRR